MRIKSIVLSLLFIGILSAQDIKVEKLSQKKADGTMERYRKMTVQGVYNGKDLYIRNSFGGNGIGFCVTQVNVNKNITTDEINADVFKIDLEIHKLKKNEKFTITIFYKDSCLTKGPLMMNQGVIKERDQVGNNSVIIEGVNYNASMHVVNPRLGKDYGIKEVLVNGRKVESINSDVFDINFYKMKIKYEEKVKIEFKYENDCDPFIINPEVISY